MIGEPNNRRPILGDTTGHEEVEQTPQLHQVVLQRRTREQQSFLSFEPQQGLPPLTPEVLDVVRLVQDHVNPIFPSEDVLIGQHDLVRRDAHLEVMLGVPTDPFLLALLLVAVVCQDFDAG